MRRDSRPAVPSAPIPLCYHGEAELTWMGSESWGGPGGAPSLVRPRRRKWRARDRQTDMEGKERASDGENRREKELRDGDMRDREGERNEDRKRGRESEGTREKEGRKEGERQRERRGGRERQRERERERQQRAKAQG